MLPLHYLHFLNWQLELHGFPIGEDENEGANISDLQLLEDIIRMNEIVAKDPQNNVELNLLQDQTESKYTHIEIVDSGYNY